ncbi:MAG: hypothetical protein GMKNLPBB_01649 [Myxococcota bacterium]|nr:hypothetical protein [Myxococcota bacterium]
MKRSPAVIIAAVVGGLLVLIIIARLTISGDTIAQTLGLKPPPAPPLPQSAFEGCNAGEDCADIEPGKLYCIPSAPGGTGVRDVKASFEKNPKGQRFGYCDSGKCAAGLECVKHPDGSHDGCLAPCRVKSPGLQLPK